MSRNCYFSSKSPHYTHEAMYRYDAPFNKIFFDSSSYVSKGQSAYEIA